MPPAARSNEAATPAGMAADSAKAAGQPHAPKADVVQKAALSLHPKVLAKTRLAEGEKPPPANAGKANNFGAAQAKLGG